MSNLRKEIFRGIVCTCLCSSFGLAVAMDNNTQISSHSDAASEAEPIQKPDFKAANLETENPSLDVRNMAAWILDSGDNHSMPFVLIDKKDAKVFVFTAKGQLRGTAPALLGMSHGDDAVPGIGERKLSSIRPEERTTPAGRFVATLDRNLHGEEILWVDYKTSISLHQVHTSNLKEQRGQRLSTPTPLDNRISFGCINVPVKFYKNVVSPIFSKTSGIVYVLPETRSLHEVFDLPDIKEYAEPLTDIKH